MKLLRIKSKCYSVKAIPKRSVGYRYLHIPQGYLKVIQLRILRMLLDTVKTPDYLYAFETGRSVVDKAAKHTGKDYVVSLDIKDFFPSVKCDVVAKVFEPLCADLDTAALLAELCTYKFHLPQGAVTSPKLSNLVVMNTFGPELEAWALEAGVTLTIYADDVTFSFDVPEESKTEEVQFVKRLVREAKTIIEKHNFKIHTKGKLKVMHKDFRQEVCGIVVNEKLSLKRDQRRILRAMVHGASIGRPVMSSGVELSIPQLLGKISWFSNFSPVEALRLKQKLDSIPESQSLLETDFDMPF